MQTRFYGATVTVTVKIIVMQKILQPHLRVRVESSHTPLLSQGLNLMHSHHAEGHIFVLSPSPGRLLVSAVTWLEQSSHLPRLVRTFLSPRSTLTN